MVPLDALGNYHLLKSSYTTALCRLNQDYGFIICYVFYCSNKFTRIWKVITLHNQKHFITNILHFYVKRYLLKNERNFTCQSAVTYNNDKQKWLEMFFNKIVISGTLLYIFF